MTSSRLKVNSLELFAGGGGLALGAARAGFGHVAVLDWDPSSCRTLRLNQENGIEFAKDWEVIEGDVRQQDFVPYESRVEFVAGGLPCQPFSLGGKHLGPADERNMFPEAVRAIREIRPKAFLFENVKGLLRPKFAHYYNYVIKQLTFPDIERRPKEEWREHLERIESYELVAEESDSNYNVEFECLNASDYGVPQKRERVFLVGVRTDIGAKFEFPSGDHSQDALLHDQWVTGKYWERHNIPKSKVPEPPRKLRGRMDKLRSRPEGTTEIPWRTVRDAICDLPPLSTATTDLAISGHYLNPGARSYAGHSGSSFDEPSKTLKAGDHGVPGGENTLRFDDDSVRYFSVRECARLQTFPDEWTFEGSWTRAMKQIGNAVPVELAARIADSLAEMIWPEDHADSFESGSNNQSSNLET